MPQEKQEQESWAWRQCDLVPEAYSHPLIEACVDLKPEFHPGKTILCIISQDCDIAAATSKEPFIDVLAGRRIEKASSEFLNTRNPRCLHIVSELGSVSFSIHDKFRIPKAALAGIIRSSTMQFSMQHRDILRRWVGRRYLRAAFPDAFNRRLSTGSLHVLEKSQMADDVSVILVWTSDEELAEGSDYHAKVILGIKDGLSEERKDEIERAFETAFSPTGIVVDDIRVSDEDDITYRNLRTYKRLEKDFRSLPDDRVAPAPTAEVDAI